MKEAGGSATVVLRSTPALKTLLDDGRCRAWERSEKGRGLGLRPRLRANSTRLYPVGVPKIRYLSHVTADIGSINHNN